MRRLEESAVEWLCTHAVGIVVTSSSFRTATIFELG